MAAEVDWDNLPPVLSTRQLAELCQTTSSTVWRWLAAGVLPAHQLGSTWIVYAEAIRATLERSDQQPYPGLPEELLANAPEILDVDELSSLLGRGARTVTDWCTQGVIPAHRYHFAVDGFQPGRHVGRSWIISKADFRDLLVRTSNQTT